MSPVADTLRRITGRSSDVVDRAAGLDQAVEAARGRLDASLLDEAVGVVERSGERLRLSSEHTVVALAGATGSGKSSLFNVLCGLELAAVGVKRPTTSWALACAWGPEGAGEILDWIGIPKRHQVDRVGMLDQTRSDRELQGLVLIDLPDHDSTEVSHHLEVEHLVKYADVLVWVLDPQKYADAAIHDRFLRPLAAHADVMMVTLNHIDELPAGGLEPTLNDVRRLLTLDGLDGVPLLGTSAKTGDGVEDLRRALAMRVSQKKAAKQRLTADVTAAATMLANQTGSARPDENRLGARDELLQACAEAAGVPVIVDAVERASLDRARAATGWPLTSWTSRWRRDPLRTLGIDLSDDPADGATRRYRVPQANSVQKARVDSAVRSVVDEVTFDMPTPWAEAVRRASLTNQDRFAPDLDDAVAKADLGLAQEPRWWGFVHAVQWLLLTGVLIGVLWLLALAGMEFLQAPELSTPAVRGLAVPTLMLVGGVILGVLLAVISRWAIRRSAKRRARRAGARLRAAIADVADDAVMVPMQSEISAYGRCRDGLAVALRP